MENEDEEDIEAEVDDGEGGEDREEEEAEEEAEEEVEEEDEVGEKEEVVTSDGPHLEEAYHGAGETGGGMTNSRARGRGLDRGLGSEEVRRLMTRLHGQRTQHL